MTKFILLPTIIFVHLMNFAWAGSNHDHHHQMIEAVSPYPTLEVEILEDAMSGYNLIINTTNFTFAPLNVNQANNGNEGHAHIYINNVKFRQYSPYFHLSNHLLREGLNEITVTLNANDHSHLMVNGNPLEEKLEVMAIKDKSKKKDNHHHGHKESHSHD